GGDAGGRNRRPASIRLKASFCKPAVAHTQIKPRQIPTAVVLVAPGAVGVTHEPRVPRIEEVIDERRAVSHEAPTGIALRTFATEAPTYSTSSTVVERPSDDRTAPIAQSSGTPIATSTCEGSTLPAVHAEPAETAMPLRSRPRTMDSDSTLR